MASNPLFKQVFMFFFVWNVVYYKKLLFFLKIICVCKNKLVFLWNKFKNQIHMSTTLSYENRTKEFKDFAAFLEWLKKSALLRDKTKEPQLFFSGYYDGAYYVAFCYTPDDLVYVSLYQVKDIESLEGKLHQYDDAEELADGCYRFVADSKRYQKINRRKEEQVFAMRKLYEESGYELEPLKKVYHEVSLRIRYKDFEGALIEFTKSRKRIEHISPLFTDFTEQMSFEHKLRCEDAYHKYTSHEIRSNSKMALAKIDRVRNELSKMADAQKENAFTDDLPHTNPILIDLQDFANQNEELTEFISARFNKVLIIKMKMYLKSEVNPEYKARVKENIVKYGLHLTYESGLRPLDFADILLHIDTANQVSEGRPKKTIDEVIKMTIYERHKRKFAPPATSPRTYNWSTDYYKTVIKPELVQLLIDGKQVLTPTTDFAKAPDCFGCTLDRGCYDCVHNSICFLIKEKVIEM